MNDVVSVIRARRAEIAAAIAELQDEERDLSVAEQVLTRLKGEEAPRLSSARASANEARPRSAQPKSQRGMVEEILRLSSKAWLKSDEIVSEAHRLWGARVPELSLRPLLTTMKRQHIIVRDGHRIALRERVGGEGAAARLEN